MAVTIKRLIDLKTLRKNPDAGRNSFLVAGKSYTHPDKPNTLVREYQRVYTIEPQPQWLYEYEPLSIICCHCGQESPIESLTEDYGWNGEDEVMICDICPKCLESDCTDGLVVIRETLEEALDRRVVG